MATKTDEEYEKYFKELANIAIKVEGLKPMIDKYGGPEQFHKYFEEASVVEGFAKSTTGMNSPEAMDFRINVALTYESKNPESDAYARRAAVEAMSMEDRGEKVKDSRAFDTLKTIIEKEGVDNPGYIKDLEKQESNAVKMAAIEMLGELEDPGAFDNLTEILRNKELDPRYRTSALVALSALKDPRAIPALREVVTEGEGNLDVLDDAIRLYVSLTKKLGDEAQATLGKIALDQDKPERLRVSALNGLGRFGDSKSVEYLGKVLKMEGPGRILVIKYATIEALEKSNNPDALGPLRNALKTEKDGEVRMKIVDAVMNIDSEHYNGDVKKALENAAKFEPSVFGGNTYLDEELKNKKIKEVQDYIKNKCEEYKKREPKKLTLDLKSESNILKMEKKGQRKPEPVAV